MEQVQQLNRPDRPGLPLWLDYQRKLNGAPGELSALDRQPSGGLPRRPLNYDRAYLRAPRQNGQQWEWRAGIAGSRAIGQYKEKADRDNLAHQQERLQAD